MSGCRRGNRSLYGWSVAVLSSTAAVLAGCATTPAAAPRQITYNCGPDLNLSVAFDGEQARIVNADGSTIDLQRRQSGSGFWYESPTHSLRGKGQSVTYTIGRMMPMECHKVSGEAAK